jgi:hypothetical protein
MAKYIDAEAVKEWVANWFYKHKLYHPYSKTNTIPITELYDILEQMPTADVAEVRHGRWEYKGKRGRFPACRCSICGNIENADWVILGDNVNYCPNCGSRMDLDEVAE